MASIFLIYCTSAVALDTQVSLEDYYSKAPLANQKIKAYKLSGTSLSYYASQSTDELGQASFNLDTSAGQQYVFKTNAYSSVASFSEVVTTQETLTFKIGSVILQAIDGNANDGSVLANHKLSVQVEKEPGKFGYYASGTTDENGLLRVDLPDLMTGKKYRFYAKTFTTQVSKYSGAISAIGEHQFVVGNKPLSLQIVDGLSQAALTNLSVEVYRLTQDNKRHWYTRQPVNDSGQVLLDLDPLTTEQGYVAKVKYFGTYFQSTILPPSGSASFAIGTSKIVVKNGSISEQPLLIDKEVSFYAIDKEGKKRWYNRVKTDSNGVIRINLDDVSAATPYQASAQSEVAKNYYYLEISKHGEYQFIVGSKPLSVNLVDGISQQGIGNTDISVYKLDENERMHWQARSKTDDTGKVNFDLVGLQQGEKYRLTAKVFNNSTSYSAVISEAGEFNFSVGQDEITILNGALANNPPMANTSITFYRVIDGKKKWHSRITSNDQGKIRTDLKDISTAQPYLVSIKSTVNGTTKYSEAITTSGSNSVVVGNPAINVKLSNILTGERYGEQKVTAYRIDNEGKKHWTQRQTTDANGIAAFDLDGITRGEKYKFSTNLFNTGDAYSDEISSAGDVDFQVGALPVTLLERDSQSAIPNKKVYVYEISDSNRLSWRARGNSDSSGDVTFDVSGLGQGKRFVLKAYDVFGEGKYYYGPVVYAAGRVTFNVKKGEGLSLDLEDPNIDILLPDTEIANVEGFTLSGIAEDNIGISKVAITQAGASSNNETITAQITTMVSGEVTWQAEIPSHWLSADEAIELVATAYDFALNDGQSSQVFLAKQDSEDPTIMITSHQNNDEVNSSGFTLEGEVTDDIKVAQVTAELIDPILGTTITNRQVLFNTSSGFWAMAVTNGKVSIDQNIIIRLEAVDASGNTSTSEISLATIEVEQNPLQLVNRITFGLTPDLLNRVKQGDDILQEQLSEQTLDDSVLEQDVASMPSETIDDVRQQTLYRMFNANKQLREVMTWFWENHFNTNYSAHQNASFELLENQQFRMHALGNFTDLLLASAKSPAMLHYLNNQQNRVGRANENYAREVMELHTLGVDGGYSDQDVAELSKIFTGWQENEGSFNFNDVEHDFSDKVVMGRAYTGVGVEEGEQVLADLAIHPSTASYLCGKLVIYLVDEYGNTALQSQCAAEFLAQQGEIKPVLQVIFNSQAFAQAQVLRDQVKTPLEMLLSIARNYSATVDAENMHLALAQLGQPLFTYPVPTGYSDAAADWINSNALLQRLRMANEIVWQQQHGIELNLSTNLISQGVDTAEAVVSYLAEISFGGQLTDVELATFTEILNQGEPFDIQAQDAELKLQRLLASIIAAPAYQMQ